VTFAVITKRLLLFLVPALSLFRPVARISPPSLNRWAQASRNSRRAVLESLIGAIRNINWTQFMRAFTVCGSLEPDSKSRRLIAE
jgi:hypothetical protein